MILSLLLRSTFGQIEGRSLFQHCCSADIFQKLIPIVLVVEGEAGIFKVYNLTIAINPYRYLDLIYGGEFYAPIEWFIIECLTI